MDAFWILALLIAVSGYFALAEMALASARRSRLVPLAENGNIAAAENVPEKYVSEAVRGAFGVFPGKRFVKQRLVLQPNGLKFAHKNDLSVC